MYAERVIVHSNDSFNTGHKSNLFATRKSTFLLYFFYYRMITATNNYFEVHMGV